MAKRPKRGRWRPSRQRTGKYRNVWRYYVLYSRRTGRQVSWAHAERYPRLKTRRQVRYRSFLTGRNISLKKLSANAKFQGLNEMHPRPLSKKQRAFWRYSLDPQRIMSEYNSQATTYKRWYIAIYDANPTLLPEKLRRHVEREKLRRAVGGNDDD